MQQLYPVARADVAPAECYEDPARYEARDRPYVFVNMVASVDGATVVNGVSRPLGSPGDRHIFFLLRSLADAILVGAGTVRTEGYGPPKIRDAFTEGRRRRGQPPVPRLAIVTHTVNLPWDAALFGSPESRPYVVAPQNADAQRLEAAADVADVITAGSPRLDLSAALVQLGERGIRALLCEGGPTLNAALMEEGLVDELCLTISPTLVGAAAGQRIVGQPSLPSPVGMRLATVLEEGGNLYLRYLLDPPTPS
jgi:riboflavin-specific deaminase-like protein